MKFLAIAAVTIDGKIAKHPKHMSNWTSKEDKVFLHWILDKCDLVIVGNNTYKTAIKPLSKRNCLVFTRSENRNVGKIGLIGSPGSPLYVNPNKVDIKKLIKKLGYKQIAILGGAQTYALCLQKNLLDEIYLTIEPLVFGKGINLFDSPKFLEKKFKLHSVKKLNEKGTILLHYLK